MEVWMSHQHVQEQQERCERLRQIGEIESYLILSKRHETMEHIYIKRAAITLQQEERGRMCSVMSIYDLSIYLIITKD